MSAFRVVDLGDAVRLAPADLGRPPADAILAALEAAYVDRVVADVGLVVAVVITSAPARAASPQPTELPPHQPQVSGDQLYQP